MCKSSQNTVPRRPMDVHTSGMGISNIKGPTFHLGNLGIFLASANPPCSTNHAAPVGPGGHGVRTVRSIAVRPGADDDMDLWNFFKH